MSSTLVHSVAEERPKKEDSFLLSRYTRLLKTSDHGSVISGTFGLNEPSDISLSPFLHEIFLHIIGIQLKGEQEKLEGFSVLRKNIFS